MRAQRIQRDSLLLKKKSRPNYQNICWGLDYTPLASEIKKIVYKHWHILEGIPGCQIKPFVGLRRKRNLRDLLMFHKPATAENNGDRLPSGFHACGHCQVCKLAIQLDSLTHNGINIVNKEFMTSSIRHIIYYVKCGCSLAYIGYTKRMIRTRTGEHRSRIRGNILDAPMVPHFVNAGHGEDDFSFCVLEHIKPRSGYPKKTTAV